MSTYTKRERKKDHRNSGNHTQVRESGGGAAHGSSQVLDSHIDSEISIDSFIFKSNERPI